jgi:hypothetical protein
MVMIIKDIMMLNPTSGEEVALKISTPCPRGDNATRSPMTILPSFTKGEGTKLSCYWYTVCNKPINYKQKTRIQTFIT